jgi:YHS domain-containing protein
MFSILVRILLPLLILWLFRRFLAAFIVAPKQTGPKSDSASPANQMVKDPVCGMYMDSRLAVLLKKRNEAFYFCSEECKKKYLSKSAGEGIAAGR